MTNRNTINTVGYYDTNADAFFDQTIGVDMTPLYARFLAHVPPGGHIEDAGCGSGRDAKAFLERGYQVSAFDASAELAQRASRLLSIPVQCRRFDEIAEVESYDAIWACASLLHVGKADLPVAVAQLTRSLRVGGVLYASFKHGVGERIDANGRYFTDMTSDVLQALVNHVGRLKLLESWQTGDRRGDRPAELWQNILVFKC